NGPEPSRARRCWARRSEPLTARTVLRRWSKRERGAKGWGAKMAPSLGASNSISILVIEVREYYRFSLVHYDTFVVENRAMTNTNRTNKDRRREPRFMTNGRGHVMALGAPTYGTYAAIIVDVSRSGLQLEV